MTLEQIAEAMRLHKLWLDNDPSGKRANLSGADLSRAKGILRVGPALDGYEFFGVQRDGSVWIKAGCRWFNTEDARKHWQTTRADTPLGRERLRFVDFIKAHFKETSDE